MLCDFLDLLDGIERRVKRCQVRLVGYSRFDFEEIGLKEEEVELWISYFGYLTSQLHSTVEALGAQPLVRDASRQA
jgi:hypothetical protein